MADQAVAMGLQAVNLGTNHYQKIWDPVQHRWKKMKGEIQPDDPDIHDDHLHDDKGYMLKKRSEVGPDEEIVEVVRRKGEVLGRKPGRPRPQRQSSSMDDIRDGDDGRNNGRDRDRGYDSEGSVPPRGRTRSNGEGGKNGKGSGSRSSSSSSLGSSTDEEKQCRKIQRKKWLTAALASVATIHAASKVYSSIEAHDKRIVAVQEGKMSPEEAHKKQRAARWQDAAAIGIAALGIKGAISEWNEMHHEHEEHKEMIKKREEHHKKRLERIRREQARDRHGYYKGRDGNWYYDGDEFQDSQRSKSQSEKGYTLDGPRSGERKMIEGPDRDQGRSAYDTDRGYGRDRRDYSPDNDQDYSSRRRSRRKDDY